MQTNAHDMYIINLQSSLANWVLILVVTSLLLLIFFPIACSHLTKNSFLIIHVVPARLSANATHCRIVILLQNVFRVFSTHSVVVLLWSLYSTASHIISYIIKIINIYNLYRYIGEHFQIQSKDTRRSPIIIITTIDEFLTFKHNTYITWTYLFIYAIS